jgi:hypothetical protein
VLSYYVSTFLVPCCDVRYYFLLKRYPVRLYVYLKLFLVCSRGHVLLSTFVCCLRIVMSNTYCVVSLYCCSSSCVTYVASFSRCLFLIAPRHSLTFMLNSLRKGRKKKRIVNKWVPRFEKRAYSRYLKR